MIIQKYDEFPADERAAFEAVCKAHGQASHSFRIAASTREIAGVLERDTVFVCRYGYDDDLLAENWVTTFEEHLPERLAHDEALRKSRP